MPSLNNEKRLWAQGLLRVVGVDEVGMAALAGPVVAAACLVTPDTRLIRKVNDSKVLTRLQREDLISRIRGRVMKVGIGAASVAEIHRLNIYHASHVAMLRALRQIGEYDWVLVDGRRILDPAFAPGRHTEIVRGDAKSFAIAAASIVAKVTRDRLMAKLAEKYPGYGWEHNCGYPTIDHRKARRELGVTPFHRPRPRRERAQRRGEGVDGRRRALPRTAWLPGGEARLGIAPQGEGLRLLAIRDRRRAHRARGHSDHDARRGDGPRRRRAPEGLRARPAVQRGRPLDRPADHGAVRDLARSDPRGTGGAAGGVLHGDRPCRPVRRWGEPCGLDGR